MFEVTYGEMTAEALATATDIAQKIEAIDGAITCVQNDRTQALAEFDAKEQALQAEKSNLRAALRGLRTVSLTPSAE